tara:strand:+ start:11307 stop:12266 length:960 start_codon:yes stop_codon:yes gene_type:complete
MAITTQRSPHNPIVHPGINERIGGNINGPSLIRVPEWVENPLGRYYLYFAHHQGKYIRLAYADNLLGPYKVYGPGVLDIEDTPFTKHIASPDVHVDHDINAVRMFYHGKEFIGRKPDSIGQTTCHAQSLDGLDFTSDRVCVGPSYLRMVRLKDYTYGFRGLADRLLWRTQNDRTLFEPGPSIKIESEEYTPKEQITKENKKNPDFPIFRMRHTALVLRDHNLDIYYSNTGDCPERIKRTTVDLSSDWTEWQGSAPIEILCPETDYEGVNQPNLPSDGGVSHDPVRQVRDPYVYVEGDRSYLVYSVAGEMGLGIAELIEN